RAVALRHHAVTNGITADPCGLWAGGGQEAKPTRSNWPAKSHLAGLPDRPCRQHPEYLQFGHARPAPGARRCANGDDGAGASRNSALIGMGLAGTLALPIF